jgi:hypothetical protein
MDDLGDLAQPDDADVDLSHLIVLLSPRWTG